MDQADRRPLKSRQWQFSHTLTHWLAARGVTPNGISVAGMFFGIAAGCALAATAHFDIPPVWFVLGAACIQLRLMCNLLDGMVAEVQKSDSPVGAMYNEVPDRVSDAATLIGGGYALGGDPVLGFVATCLAIFIAYIRAQGKVAGGPQDFAGPMAKPQRMFVMTVASLYAAFAPAFLQPQWESLPGFGTLAVALTIIIAGEVVTVVRRLWRISAALRSST